MRYVTNADGYLVTVSFGGEVECDWGICTEYEGSVPTGYTSLEAWYTEEVEQLHRWKVVGGQLTLDADAAAPPQCNSWVDRIYPVGSIYMSVNPADPADLFGGTWKRIEDTFLLAAGATYAAGTTGGEAAVSLTAEQNGPHYHTSHDIAVEKYDGGYVVMRSVGFSDQDDTRVSKTAESGAGEPHNNMPPYLAVYVWQRTE